MTQENLEMRLAGNPNFTARSTTGTTRPRRFVTPRIQIGVLGTVVTASYSMISLTFPIPIAYSSPAVRKVRYCTVLKGDWSLPRFDAPIEFHSSRFWRLHRAPGFTRAASPEPRPSSIQDQKGA